MDKSEELAVVPQVEISISTESAQHSLETTGDIANQIEEGMKKLMDEHDKIGDDHVQNDEKERGDSNESSNVGTIIDEIKVSNKSDELEKDNSPNEGNKQIPDLEVSSIIADLSKDPNIELNSQNYDKPMEKIVKEENDTSSLVEAYNNEFKSISRNSSIINGSMIKFDEMEPIKHSTPVKVDISRAKENSLEETASAHSYSGSFYPSPSGSIADNSSYQESTPPLEKKHKDSSNMHRKISGNFNFLNNFITVQWFKALFIQLIILIKTLYLF